MIKRKLSLFALVALGVVAFATPSQAATYSAGDLILGFRVTGGTGAGSDLLVNLGASTTYRDLNGSNLWNITNIGTDLVATYGSNWYDRTDLSFGIAGVYTNISDGNGGTNNNGDPGQTLYFTKSRTAVGTVGSASSSVTSNYSNTNMSTASAGMQSLGATTYAGATASSNNSKVAIVSSSGGNSWTTYTSGASDFGVISGGVEQVFASGSWQGGTFGAASNVEGALDLYRYLQTTTGASPSGTAKTGLYLGSVVIDQTGNLNAIVNSAAVPEPSTFAMAGIAAIAAGFVAYRRKKVSSSK